VGFAAQRVRHLHVASRACVSSSSQTMGHSTKGNFSSSYWPSTKGRARQTIPRHLATPRLASSLRRERAGVWQGSPSCFDKSLQQW